MCPKKCVSLVSSSSKSLLHVTFRLVIQVKMGYLERRSQNTLLLSESAFEIFYSGLYHHQKWKLTEVMMLIQRKRLEKKVVIMT